MQIQFYTAEPAVSDAWRHRIDVVCSAYRRPGPLRVFVQALLNQEADNWRLQVIHDGPDPDFDLLADSYRGVEAAQFWSSEQRFNDHGHSLRALGLQRTAGDYVLITNDDNYYLPSFLRYVNGAIAAAAPDIVLVDMIHGHAFPGGRLQLAHTLFETCLQPGGIDMGCAVVRGDLARQVGFNGREFAADARYFQEVARARGRDLRVVKIPRVLFVHN